MSVKRTYTVTFEIDEDDVMSTKREVSDMSFVEMLGLLDVERYRIHEFLKGHKTRQEAADGQ